MSIVSVISIERGVAGTTLFVDIILIFLKIYFRVYTIYHVKFIKLSNYSFSNIEVNVQNKFEELKQKHHVCDFVLYYTDHIIILDLVY